MNDSELIAFKAISSFVVDIGETFGNRQKSLALYKRLIEKTTIVNVGPIKKHVEAFRIFSVKNRDAILTKDVTKLVEKTIVYSENKVYINLEHLLKFADKEQTDIVWKHILTISALVDPTAKAKDVLKKDMEKKQQSGGDGNEEQFLTNIIDKVEDHVNPESNPMEAVSSIMKSGIFTDLIGSMNSGVSNGELDLSKLMGTVQNMMSQLGNMSDATDDDNGMGNMMNSMMGMMGGTGSPLATVEEVTEEAREENKD